MITYKYKFLASAFKSWSIIVISSSLVICIGCKKNWLDAKPQLSLIVPSTIADYQALLDNTASGTAALNVNGASLNEEAADDYYVTDDSWNKAPQVDRNIYLWNPDIYAGVQTNSEWNGDYRHIFYANIVLDGSSKVTPVDNGEQTALNQVKGSAYFFRAINHYDIAQEFCKTYISTTAANDMGIPLKLTSDFNEKIIRSSVKQTYDQIINDLKQAESLLPVTTPVPSIDTTLYRLRPNKAAATAMLARVYLTMGDYDNALTYADKCLQSYNALLDFTTLDSTKTAPIGRFNKEVLFHLRLTTQYLMANVTLIVDSTLYQSYVSNDLRRALFFKRDAATGFIRYKGSYDGSSTTYFGGLTTDETYLIRAECYARKGDVTHAMQDLNTLLLTRWKKGTFINYTATDATDALKKIISERRKELCFRGRRWTELRRLNTDPQFAITLKRIIGGQTYTLPPNDLRYSLPIGTDVITLSGISQNPR